MLSPIATLVSLSGMSATLAIPTGADAASYSPTAVGDFARTPGTPVAIVGVFSKNKIAGIRVEQDALFLVDATALPAGIAPEKGALVYGGVSYTVDKFDPRYWMGAFDGYNLHLKA